jgi:hypothetical protein
MVRTFECKSKDIILNLYKSLVRSHLEYCVQAWSPHLRKDIELIEKVQHRATKMIHGLGKYFYEKRLAILGITKLKTRRMRGDIVEVFQIHTCYMQDRPACCTVVFAIRRMVDCIKAEAVKYSLQLIRRLAIIVGDEKSQN